jgi:outer membrane biosynthesis protein TonB
MLALIGAILAAATFFATSAARQQATAPAATPAAEQPKPAVKKAVGDKPAVKPKKSKAVATPAKPAEEKAVAKAPAKPAKPAKPAAPKVVGVPAPVARALAKKRVVILFFRQSGAADDRAVASAVNAQKGRKGVSVFSDKISRLARYRAAVGQLGISQAPAVVIVGRDGKAQIVEGFVDEGTLTQQVVDAK